MTTDEALAELREIVQGIDSDDHSGNDDAWWETSTGAAYGAQKLAELEDLIRRLTA